MRLLNISIAVSLLILTACSGKKQAAESTTAPDDPAKFKIQRGTNIAHWLSQSAHRGETRAQFFTQKDVMFIDSAGFDHIRLPVDEEQLWDSQGKRYDSAFTLLDNCLRWCSDAGIKVVLDLHILRSHYFNSEVKPLWSKVEEQDKFIHLWRDLAGFAKKWPNDMVAYEFMNEPVADKAAEWNTLLLRVADSIRRWEPERVLVIGSNRWQSVDTFDSLEVPTGDRNIILSFHFYEPFLLTHYKTSWTRLKDFKSKVTYPGQIVPGGKLPEEQRIYNRDTLEKMLAKPLALAAKLNLPLYCGEFGVFEAAPEDAKLAWYADMVAILDKHNVAYANWNYKSRSFGIVEHAGMADSAMVKLLTGR